MKQPARKNKILGSISMVSVPATERFISKEYIVLDKSSNAKVKISYVGDNFMEWFMAGKNKVEEVKAETTLSYAKLLKGSDDAPIIAELGGEARAYTTISEIFALLCQQPNPCEAGVLLANGHMNIFYVRDIAGVLRTVFLLRYRDGWGMDANSVGDVLGWFDGNQVFFRN